MSLTQRDKDILKSLELFRVLDRDQVIELHFQSVKDKVNSCNKVLKRLQRDGHVVCDLSRRPYEYFPNPRTLKKNSSKIPHFKSLADVVIESRKLGSVRELEVEVKLGEKGTVEPDLFMIWNNAPMFIEVQRSVFSQKQMKDKMERYVRYYEKGDWKELHWQRSVKYFPYVLIITERPYTLEKLPFKVFQATSMKDFYEKYVKK